GVGITKKPRRRADRYEDDGITQNLPSRFLCSSNYGKHRQTGARVLIDANERQRPEMRRRPEEDDEEEQTRLDRDTAGGCRPAQPMIGGSEPAAPPMTMFWGVTRFSQAVYTTT